MAKLIDGLLAKKIASKGRYGDTELAHITKDEATLLEALGGAGTRNPKTGLKEYHGPSENIKSIPFVGPQRFWNKYMDMHEGIKSTVDHQAWHFSGGEATAEEWSAFEKDRDDATDMWSKFKSGKIDELPEGLKEYVEEYGYTQFGNWENIQDMGEEEMGTVWKDKDGKIVDEGTTGATKVATISHRGTDALNHLLKIVRTSDDKIEVESAKRMIAESMLEHNNIPKSIDGEANPAYFDSYEKIMGTMGGMLQNFVAHRDFKEEGIVPNELFSEITLSSEQMGVLDKAVVARDAAIETAESIIRTKRGDIGDFQDQIDKILSTTIPGYQEQIRTMKEETRPGYEQDIKGYEEDIRTYEEEIAKKEREIGTSKEETGTIAESLGEERKKQYEKIAATGRTLTPEMKEYYEKYGEGITGEKESLEGKLSEIRNLREAIGSKGNPGPDGEWGTEDDVLPTGKLFDIFEKEKSLEIGESGLGEQGYFKEGVWVPPTGTFADVVGLETDIGGAAGMSAGPDMIWGTEDDISPTGTPTGAWADIYGKQKSIADIGFYDPEAGLTGPEYQTGDIWRQYEDIAGAEKAYEDIGQYAFTTTEGEEIPVGEFDKFWDLLYSKSGLTWE